MRTAIHNPLVSGMDIRRELPVHESSRRLRALFPGCPLVYGIAVLDDVSRQRWWPLDSQRTDALLRAMFDDAAKNIGPHAATRQLVASLIHEIIGRMLPLVLLEGKSLGRRPGESLAAPRSRRCNRLGRGGGPHAARAARRSLRGRAQWRCLRAAPAPRGRAHAAERSGTGDLGGASLPPEPVAAVRLRARNQQRRRRGHGDVAHRGVGDHRGGRPDPAPGARGRPCDHPPKPGHPRCDGRIRAAGTPITPRDSAFGRRTRRLNLTRAAPYECGKADVFGRSIPTSMFPLHHIHTVCMLIHTVCMRRWDHECRARGHSGRT